MYAATKHQMGVQSQTIPHRDLHLMEETKEKFILNYYFERLFFPVITMNRMYLGKTALKYFFY